MWDDLARFAGLEIHMDELCLIYLCSSMVTSLYYPIQRNLISAPAEQNVAVTRERARQSMRARGNDTPGDIGSCSSCSEC